MIYLFLFSNFDIFSLISQSDIVSLNYLWYWKLLVSVTSNTLWRYW